MPFKPNPYARRGTAFHAWLERRYGASRLLDLDELPGAADGDAGADENLALVQRRFEESEWAARTPVDIEVPFAIAAAGTVVRGRMDAVFRDPGGETGGKRTANLVFGNPAAVLVGDFLFSRSFELMVEADSLAALKILSNASAVIGRPSTTMVWVDGSRMTRMSSLRSMLTSRPSAWMAAATSS